MLRRCRRWRIVRPRRGEARIARRFVDQLRIRTPSIEQEVGNLSGGNQQKIVLARWLARRPKVLILDEPTRGVDVGAKAEIYSIINTLAAEGMALLVISSEMPEMLGLADRILVMQAGRITGELARAEATEEKRPDPGHGRRRRSTRPRRRQEAPMSPATDASRQAAEAPATAGRAAAGAGHPAAPGASSTPSACRTSA